MLRLRKALLLTGLLFSPAAVFAQAAPGKVVVDLDKPASGLPSVPALPDVIPNTPLPAGPAENVDQGYFMGGGPDHRFLPDNYLFPDFAWLKRDRYYRWDGRLRLDLDYLSMSTTSSPGISDDRLEGVRLGFLLWLDKDQRIGLQGNLFGSVNNLDDISDLRDINGDVLDGISSINSVLGGRSSLGPAGVFNAELLGRGLLLRSDNFRLDALLGVRTFGFGSALVTRDVTAGGIPVATLAAAGLNPSVTSQVINLSPTSTVPFADFSGRAVSSFWIGGEAGIAAEYWFGRIWVEGAAKLGYGQAQGVGRVETFILNPGTPTANRTAIDIDDNKTTFLNELGIGTGFMITRHLAIRANYSYTRIGNMFQNDAVPGFRSYNLHTVGLGLTARF